jgi:hypothetical protein
LGKDDRDMTTIVGQKGRITIVEQLGQDSQDRATGQVN